MQRFIDVATGRAIDTVDRAALQRQQTPRALRTLSWPDEMNMPESRGYLNQDKRYVFSRYSNVLRTFEIQGTYFIDRATHV